jgi:uncharacterized protein (DUF433 family)
VNTGNIGREYLIPAYSQADVAQIIRATPSTVQRWTTGYSDRGAPIRPLVSGVKPGRGYTVPFIGLAEAYVLNAFRKAGLPMQRIRPAVEVLKKGIVGLEYVLANDRLVTDGAEILYRSDDMFDRRLIVLRNGQAVFAEVVQDFLKEIDFGPMGYATSIRLPQFADVDVIIRPELNGGRPTLKSRGIAVDDVLGRVRAGEAPGEVAEDYGISHDEVMYLNRVAA